MYNCAKVIVKGSPITKSNFKLHNAKGRAILPDNSGKYHDRYALYEQEIALLARSQNPTVVLSESLIAILKVYYKSEKRHPDTINITKSIFDGIEKSGLIINDAQITKIFTEEYYDKENPRFELELYPESEYEISFQVTKKICKSSPKVYSSNKKSISNNINKEKELTPNSTSEICSICKKKLYSNDYIKANNGSTSICRRCFSKLF